MASPTPSGQLQTVGAGGIEHRVHVVGDGDVDQDALNTDQFDLLAAVGVDHRLDLAVRVSSKLGGCLRFVAAQRRPNRIEIIVRLDKDGFHLDSCKPVKELNDMSVIVKFTSNCDRVEAIVIPITN